MSVIIPVYNREKCLAECIDSILAQSYTNWEAILIDDGSTDKSIDIIKKYSDKDKRIKFFERKRLPKGANTCRNIGIENANGDYIAMLDSDDKYLPNHFARRIKLIQEWNCDGIFGSAYINDGNQIRIALSRPFHDREEVIDYLLSDGFAPTPSHFYRRETVMCIKWDETLQRHQDYDFTIRFCDKYEFRSDYEPTILINWPEWHYQKLSSEQFISQKRFIEKYKSRLSPQIYTDYLKRMLIVSRKCHNQNFINYYEKQIVEYIDYISINSYFSIRNVKSASSKLIVVILFCYLNIKIKLQKLLLNKINKY